MTRRRLAMVVVVALVQIAIVAGLALRQEVRLASGRDVILRVEPIDPRDILRGDYVRLGYTLERLPATVAVEPAVEAGRPAWLVLALDDDSRPASVVGVLAAPSATLAADQVALRVAWRRTAEAAEEAHRLALPEVDRYFVPEGTGPALEDALRAGTVEVLLRVDGDGAPLIAGILIDGTLID